MVEGEKIVFKLSKILWNECKERELKLQQKLEEKEAELAEHKNLVLKNISSFIITATNTTTNNNSNSNSNNNSDNSNINNNSSSSSSTTSSSNGNNSFSLNDTCKLCDNILKNCNCYISSLLINSSGLSTSINSSISLSSQKNLQDIKEEEEVDDGDKISEDNGIMINKNLKDNNKSNNNSNNSNINNKIQTKISVKRGRKRKLLDDKITYQNLLSNLIRLRDTLSDEQLHSYVDSKSYEQYLGGVSSLTKKELIQHLISLRVEYVQRLMRPIIQKMISHPRNGDVFNHPVDHITLGLRDYLQRIPHPMDLGSVRCNLLQGDYYTIDDFIKDVYLVFNNAISYNPSSHVIHQNAIFLKDEFQEDIKSLQDRLTKEEERKSQHYCDVCLGSTCVICNERCLKLEPTILVCYGPCGQRIKKQGTYYISVDGSLLWCQKCYSSANSVIVESYEADHSPLLKKDLLKRKFDEEVVETWIECSTCSRRIHQICALYNNLHDVEAVKQSGGFSEFYECPLCKLEITPESLKKNNSTQLSLSSSSSSSSTSKRTKSISTHVSNDNEIGGDDGEGDENNNINFENNNNDNYVDNDDNNNNNNHLLLQNIQETNSDNTMMICHSTMTSISTTMSHTYLPFTEFCDSNSLPSISRTISFQDQPNIVQFGDVNINYLPSIKGQRTGSSDTSYESFDIQDRELISNNTFPSSKYLDYESNNNGYNNEDVGEDDSMCVVTDNDAELDEDEVEIENEEQKLMSKHDHKEYQYNNDLVDNDNNTDDININSNSINYNGHHEPEQQEEKNILDNRNNSLLSSISTTTSSSTLSSSPSILNSTSNSLAQDQLLKKQRKQKTQQLLQQSKVQTRSQSSSSSSLSQKQKQQLNNSSKTSKKQLGRPKKNQKLSSSSSSTSSSSSSIPIKQEPPKEQWKASRLPRTRLSDFIESMVGERLKQCGYEDVMKTLTIRMTSNSFHNFEVPDVITNNLPTSDGYHVNEFIYYKQKCILLFQNIDGVDVCLFCLYVQEFDDSCPEPNKSKVYIAYLDSVEYFRPRCVRTTVYHEILVAYLKWCQVRGFKQCHIWACPPQRGDNFIFWCHNPQQRNPSRDRLNSWYNTMLTRANQLGILKSIDTLWASYFSNYGKRDELSQRTASKNSFVTKNSILLASKSSSNSTSTKNSEPPPPVCPPIFEGDFWVNECVRVFRLVQVRNKGFEGQDKNINIRKCRDILKHMMSKPMAAAFNQPVDCILLNIPDYPTIVKEPMDLSTIRNKLRGNSYKTILDFAKDVRLTFNNAMLYNPSGHPVHIYAKKLLEDFEQSLYDLVSERLGEMLLQLTDIDSNLESYPLISINQEKTSLSLSTSNSFNNNSNVNINSTLPILSSSSSFSTLTTNNITRLSQTSNYEGSQDTQCSTRHVSFIDGGDCKKEFEEDNNNNSNNNNNNNNLIIQNSYSYDMGEGIDINMNIIQTPSTSILTPTSLPLSSSNNEYKGEDERFFECDGKNDEIDDGDMAPRLLRQDSTDSCISLNESWSRRSDHINSHVCSSSDSRKQSERKIFEKSQLGQKGVITLMTELSRNVYRLKDDMYVITFNDSTINSINSSTSLLSSSSSTSDLNLINKDKDKEYDSSKKIVESCSNRGGKGRGKGLSVMGVNSTTNHSGINSDQQSLTTISLNCLEYLKCIDQTLSLATNDPDNEFYCPFIDSRQTFLEICQYRHFQFDTLRRAKHSSIMLVYHLLYPYSQYTRPKCSLCNNIIQYVLWHCTECNLFWNTNHMHMIQNDNTIPNVCCHDICNNCYIEMKTKSNPRYYLHHELTPIRLTFI